MPLHPQIEELGRVPALDPFEVQPGAIVLDRFCVLGRVRHARAGWRVRVTDLQRALGLAPHHRLMLHHLEIADDQHAIVRRAVMAHRGSPMGVFVTDSGLAVLTEAHDAIRVTPPAPPHLAFGVATDLVERLAELHDVGITGARFDLSDVRVDASGHVTLDTLHHLVALREGASVGEAPDDDLQALRDCLGELGCPELDGALAIPGTALDLLRRLRSGHVDHLTAADVLPSRAPFVGRGPARSSALRTLREARDEGPSALIVEGGAGAGKSRLLQELANELHRERVQVLRVSAVDGRTTLRALADDVARLLLACAAAEREQLRTRILRAVGPTLESITSLSPALRDELGEGASLSPVGLDEHQHRTAATMADALAAIGTRESPLVLLVDGADEADPGARAILYNLLGPTRRHHTAIVATATSAAAVELEGTPTTIALPGLDDVAIHSLVDASLPGAIERPGAVVRALLRATSGAPLEVWTTLRRWIEDGDLSRTNDVWTLGAPSPHSVVDLTEWTLRRLSPAGRRGLALVAVHRHTLSLQQLHDILDQPDDAGEVASALIRSGLLLEDAHGHLVFLHRSVREQVLEMLAPEERLAAHASLAAWLARLGARPVDLAWHREHIVPPGRDAALAELHLGAATQLLEALEASRAGWHAARALERVPGGEISARHHRVHGDALLLQNQIPQALDAYRAAMTTQDAAPVELASHVAMALFKRGSAGPVLELCNLALVPLGLRLPTGRGRQLWMLLVTSLWIASGHRPIRDGELADRVTVLHTTLAAILPGVDMLLMLLCALRARAMGFGRKSGASARGRAFFSMLLTTRLTERRMRALLDEAQVDADRSGDLFALATVHHFRAQNLLELGHIEAGLNAASRAVETFRRAGDMSIAVNTMAIATFHELDRAPVPALLEYLDHAERAAWRHQNVAMVPSIRAMRLWVRCRRGEDVTDEARALGASLEPAPQDQLSDLVAVSMLARALASGGELALARRMAQRALDTLAANAMMPGFTTVALLANAEVELAAAEAEGATGVLDRAIDALSRRRGLPTFIAPAVAVLQARACQLRGDAVAAREHLVRALDLAAPLGCRWQQRDSHELLAELEAGHDILRARAHAERASVLTTQLDPDAATLLAPDAGPHEDSLPAQSARNRAQSVTELVRGLERTLDRALPEHLALRTRVSADLVAEADLDQLELLLVNLSLVARDVARGRGILELTAAPDEGGVGAALTLIAPGPHDRSVDPQLDHCRQLAHTLGASLTVGDDDGRLVMVVHLEPSERTPQRAPRRASIAVMHHDERIQRTLVEGVTRLGYDAIQLRAQDSMPHDVALALVSPELHAPGASLRQVVVLPRRQAREVTTPTLPVPFVMDELAAVLERGTEHS